MENYIISAPHVDAGLSNRIKCLLTTLDANRLLKRKVLLRWEANFSCGARFNDLFDNDFPEADSAQIKSKDNIIIDTWKLPYDCDFKFNEIPFETRNIILRYLNSLHIKKDIIEKVDIFLKSKIQPQMTVVGIHARRNEFLLNKDKSTSTDDLFFKRMDELIEKDSNTYFFLATDSKKTEQKFINKYQERIIVYSKSDLDRNNPETIKEALAELLILSRFKYILGTYLSTYTEMAWWFGGAQAKIEIIGNKTSPLVTSEVNSTSKLSLANQWLRRNSSIFRKIMRIIGYWG